MTNNKKQTYFLLLIFSILFLPNLLLRDPWSPDEPRYVEITRQVLQTETPLVLRLNGEYYAEKPPLFFYVSSFFDLFIPAYGTRIVETSAVLALVFLLRQLIAGRDAKSRLYAPLIFMTTLSTFECGRFAVIDTFLLCFLALGILYGRKAVVSKRPLKYWIYCYAALAFGNLVKGPVILPFAILALAGSRKELTGSFLPRKPVETDTRSHFSDIGSTNASTTRSLKDNILAHLAGICVFTFIILIWLVPACIQGGDDYTKTLLGQIHERISGQRESHNQPFYFYFLHIFYVFFPWTLLFCAAAFTCCKNKNKQKNMWLLIWFAAGLFFLSAIKSKRTRYLSFILLPGSILTAQYLAHLCWNRINRIILTVTSSILAVSAVAVFLCGPVLYFLLRSDAFDGTYLADTQILQKISAIELWLYLPLAATCMIAASVKALYSVKKQQAGTFLWSSVLFICIAGLIFDFGITPYVNPVKSGREFKHQVRKYAENHKTAFYLHRTDYDGRFNRILNRNKIPVVSDYHKTLSQDKPAAVIMGSRKKSLDKYCASIAENNHGFILAKGRLGGRCMLLVGNRASTDNNK